MSTPLAKKVFELFGKPEQKPIAEQSRAPDYRRSYQQAAETVNEDCFAVDPCWLVDRCPELWRQMVGLDGELNTLEQRNATQEEYQAALTQLVAVVQKARAEYERECKPTKEPRQ